MVMTINYIIRLWNTISFMKKGFNQYKKRQGGGSHRSTIRRLYVNQNKQ